MGSQTNKQKFAKALAVILVVGGLLGLFASFTLTYDKIQVLHDPNYRPNCNINPVLSCGSVMKTEQANLLGLPNTVFGIAGYTAFTMFGLLMLARTKFERRVWLALQVGVTAAVVFMHYLFFEGIFRIHAICPFCFLTWMATAPIFWYTTVYNLQHDNLRLGAKWVSVRIFVLRHHGDIMGLWYVIIFGILLKQFWYYWKTLI